MATNEELRAALQQLTTAAQWMWDDADDAGETKGWNDEYHASCEAMPDALANAHKVLGTDDDIRGAIHECGCPFCDAMNGPMGVLGTRVQFRCRQCGAQYSQPIPTPESESQEVGQ